MKNEVIPKEAISTDLLGEDIDIFKKLDIPWTPDDEQDNTTGKPFDSDKENLQKTIK